MTVIPGVASPRAPVCEKIAGHGTCEVYFTDGTVWSRQRLGTGAEPEQNRGAGGGGQKGGKGKREARQSVVTGILKYPQLVIKYDTNNNAMQTVITQDQMF